MAQTPEISVSTDAYGHIHVVVVGYQERARLAAARARKEAHGRKVFRLTSGYQGSPDPSKCEWTYVYGTRK
jgi:hypothetical protein